MPRIENTGESVDKWYEEEGRESGEGTTTADVCADCWDEYYEESFAVMGIKIYGCDPVGDSSEEIDTPVSYEYEYQTGSPYLCECCFKELRSEDQ